MKTAFLFTFEAHQRMAAERIGQILGSFSPTPAGAAEDRSVPTWPVRKRNTAGARTCFANQSLVTATERYKGDPDRANKRISLKYLGIIKHLIAIAFVLAIAASGRIYAEPAGVGTALGRLPLQFEVNHGQVPAGGDYLARGPGYLLSLTATEATFTLQKPPARFDASAVSDERSAPAFAKRHLVRKARPAPERVTMRLRLLGAAPQAAVSGVDALPGRVNHISGQDSAKWYTNLPTYAKVRYESVYPGIDVIYYGNDQRRLEYDFQVAPGADPTAIRLKFDGIDALEVDSAGELVAHTAAGDIRQQRPQIYQEVAGVRQTVPGGYVVTDSGEVGFALGQYDASRPLIIDPTIAYSTFLGGVSSDPFTSDKDAGNDIAVDATGNIYVVGETNALGRYDTDVFVRKFNPSGSALLYETYLDSNGSNDAGNGIAVDAAGNAYVTGQFGDPILPGWANGVLVAKLSPTGVPIYEGTFGANSPGYSMDEGRRIAVDPAGNAYVVGTTYGLGTPFPTTPGAFQESFGGGLTDAFVAKVNPSGTDLVYSTLLGGSGPDEGWGIAIRNVGGVYNAYVTGTTSLPGFGVPDDFPTTPGSLQPAFGGAADAFIAQLNDTGSALVYSTYLGGNGLDQGLAIAVDAAGYAYLTGLTGKEPLDSVSRFPIVNAFQPVYGGEGGATPADANAFVAKLNPSGSALVFSSYMGGGGYGLYDAGIAIKVDAAGYAYLTGITETATDIFTGAHFPIVNAFQPQSGGGVADAFVAKLTPQGALVYSSYLGGNHWDEGHGIAVDAAGNVYVTGATSSVDFPVTPGAYQPQHSSGGCSYPFLCPDAFVTKIAEPVPTLRINDVTKAEGNTGVTVFNFTVTLSSPRTSNVTVNIATANGTALAGSDYAALPLTTLTFTPGQTSKTVNVNVSGDTTVEPNDTFSVNLSGAVGATIADSQGVGTISNDDSATLRISDVNQAEGNTGASNFVFTVTLSNPSASNVTVNAATANGTALAGSDYTALPPTTLTFTPGQTSKTIAVPVLGNTLVEPNESFTVNLTGAVGATIADGQGLGTILNDDGPVLRINDVALAEGNAGASNFVFTVALVPASTATVTVIYATANSSALAGSDYAVMSGTLTFAPGQTSKTITVPVLGDTAIEPNEAFLVNLSSAVGATIFDAQGVGVILNDDGPVLRINDVAKIEGNTGVSNLVFTVSLAPASTGTVTVNYATANRTALAGSDFTAASGTLTFTPGQTSKTVAVPVNGDTLVEPNETFLVNLGTAVGATIFDAQGVGTITNDD